MRKKITNLPSASCGAARQKLYKVELTIPVYSPTNQNKSKRTGTGTKKFFIHDVYKLFGYICMLDILDCEKKLWHTIKLIP